MAPFPAKVAVVGSGNVGLTLAKGFRQHGAAVFVGTRNPEKLGEFASKHPDITIGAPADACAFGDVVVLAVPGHAAKSVAQDVRTQLQGKIVMDTNNPISGVGPGGVFNYFTDRNSSLLEILQAEVPGARWVKAFNSVGAEMMVNPALPGGPPTMFICGDDTEAKAVIAAICVAFGWDPLDMGVAAAARAIEPLCQLWCIPAMTKGERTWGAFKFLKSA